MPNRRGAPLSEPVVRATQVDFPRKIALGRGFQGLLSGLGIFLSVTKSYTPQATTKVASKVMTSYVALNLDVSSG